MEQIKNSEEAKIGPELKEIKIGRKIEPAKNEVLNDR